MSMMLSQQTQRSCIRIQVPIELPAPSRSHQAPQEQCPQKETCSRPIRSHWLCNLPYSHNQCSKALRCQRWHCRRTAFACQGLVVGRLSCMEFVYDLWQCARHLTSLLLRNAPRRLQASRDACATRDRREEVAARAFAQHAQQPRSWLAVGAAAHLVRHNFVNALHQTQTLGPLCPASSQLHPRPITGTFGQTHCGAALRCCTFPAWRTLGLHMGMYDTHRVRRCGCNGFGGRPRPLGVRPGLGVAAVRTRHGGRPVCWPPKEGPCCHARHPMYKCKRRVDAAEPSTPATHATQTITLWSQPNDLAIETMFVGNPFARIPGGQGQRAPRSRALGRRAQFGRKYSSNHSSHM